MEAFVSIDHAANFIVLKTLPGNANAIGALIDELDWKRSWGRFAAMIRASFCAVRKKRRKRCSND